jgi:hypothetical protein
MILIVAVCSQTILLIIAGIWDSRNSPNGLEMLGLALHAFVCFLIWRSGRLLRGCRARQVMLVSRTVFHIERCLLMRKEEEVLRRRRD